MIRNNPRIKKLSTAIRRGYEICKERGIKTARGEFLRFNKNEEITCACALGVAAIGLYGVNEAAKHSEDTVLNNFHLKDVKSSCVAKQLNPRNVGYSNIEDSVIHANDSKKWSPDKIADVLEECKL